MINILVLVASLSQPVDIPTIMVTPQEQEAQRQQAIRFMDEYFQHFSNPDVLTLFQRDYAGYIDYYGKVTDKNDVMGDKAHFVKRWPQRSYHPHQMQSSCVTVRGDVVCSVAGLVDFECSSPDRHARSKGVARFMAHVWYGGSHPQIIGERSMVVG